MVWRSTAGAARRAGSITCCRIRAACGSCDARHSTAVASRLPDQRYARVSATITPLSAISATRASFSLRVTIQSLMAGVHVESKSLHELMEAERVTYAAGVPTINPWED